jgi:hypothetical protein
METREILLKAEKGTLSWERIDGGIIRFKTSRWDDAVVTTRSQVLEWRIANEVGGEFSVTQKDIRQRGSFNLLAR